MVMLLLLKVTGRKFLMKINEANYARIPVMQTKLVLLKTMSRKKKFSELSFSLQRINVGSIYIFTY